MNRDTSDKSSDNTSDKPQAQPWHEADEKKKDKPGNNAPIGTHSLTGGSAEVGLPPGANASAGPDDADGASRVGRAAHEDLLSPGEPDLIDEPRAGRADMLGRKDGGR